MADVLPFPGSIQTLTPEAVVTDRAAVELADLACIQAGGEVQLAEVYIKLALLRLTQRMSRADQRRRVGLISEIAASFTPSLRSAS